jgi:hypothetical protein
MPPSSILLPTETPFFTLPTATYIDHSLEETGLDGNILSERLDLDSFMGFQEAMQFATEASDTGSTSSTHPEKPQFNTSPNFKLGSDDEQVNTCTTHSRDNVIELSPESRNLNMRPVCVNLYQTQRQRSIATGMLDSTSADDQTALTYYVELIFPTQFPFIEAATGKITCHDLVWLARLSNICLAAIISQSIYCQNVELLRVGLDTESSFDQVALAYENTAQEGLRKSLVELAEAPEGIEHDNLKSRVIEAQVCAVLIIFSKVRVLNTLFDKFSEALTDYYFIKIYRRDGRWPEILKLIAVLPAVDFSGLTASYLSSLSLFQSALICFDILACASTQLPPSFALRFDNKFSDENYCIKIQDVIGCDNTVMACIMRIAELRAWKQKEMLNESMSLIELAKQAMLLDKDLTEVRHGILKQLAQYHHPKLSKIGAAIYITNVYACAASVYLHSTVSGPHLEIAEIKKGVTDTTNAIRSIPQAGLLKRLLWPVCVAASMADGDCRSFYEQLSRGLAESFGSNDNIHHALRIAKECWSLRRCSPSSKKAYDWTDAMASIGDPLLLAL